MVDSVWKWVQEEVIFSDSNSQMGIGYQNMLMDEACTGAQYRGKANYSGQKSEGLLRDCQMAAANTFLGTGHTFQNAKKPRDGQRVDRDAVTLCLQEGHNREKFHMHLHDLLNANAEQFEVLKEDETPDRHYHLFVACLNETAK